MNLDNLTVKVYGDDGRLLDSFHADSHEQAIQLLSMNRKAAAQESFKVRIEDEGGHGCWMIVGPRPEGI